MRNRMPKLAHPWAHNLMGGSTVRGVGRSEKRTTANVLQLSNKILGDAFVILFRKFDHEVQPKQAANQVTNHV